ncbi:MULTISPECIES: L-alanine exporter AlaE [Martelella]|uniref:L-alanine exporter AlaE n=1 Tax=Martelella mediterranea DSM 17316 TaxID=1122214 RepID=A0A1U9Z274_9HYPH|nr:L-alanine exporter AlaE [Martelella mediterranea]AQZ51760.1 L-alanine exporter AlaE [Martelella mediterranea DSM 17316]
MSPRMLNFIADTTALVIFFTIVSGFNERLIAGMAWSELLVSRSIGAVLMVLTARPYGLWRDFLFGKVEPKTRTGEFATDCFSLLAFQVPIYIAIIAVGGASGMGILKGAAGFAVLMLVLGRPYGMFLEFVRSRFGLAGKGQKPMSLGG